MAIPAAYTENELKEYMVATLGALGAALALTTVDFGEAVNDTLLAYGIDEIDQATDIAKLRGLAKIEAWKVALAAAGGRIDWSEAGASFKQSQYRQPAKDGLELAVAEAQAAGYIPDQSLAGYEIAVGQLRVNDPYQ